MNAEERRSQLLELVRHRGFAALPDLASEMSVSESTVRRDLDQLEQSGEAKRTHGGVYDTGATPKLPHFEQRQAAQWEKKKRIAETAMAIIEDGDTLLLDGGSTTYELAKLLVGRPLQVVTNSLPVANLFIAGSNTDLILVGGYVHPRTGVLLGPYADHMISTLNVRRAVLSVAGISERGCFNSNLLLVETERKMMQAADEVIVLADRTKIGRQSLALMCELSAVNKLVVDNEISQDWRSIFTAAGIELHIAGATDNG
jgi:DeoR/GlpR family transcriptional regulator of sugar metabolism